MAYAIHQSTHELGDFRSHLEKLIADELHAHCIEFTYEQEVDWPAGMNVKYIPDFYIHPEQTVFDALSPEPLPLPRWVEGKPIQFLYDLRNYLGVTRRHGEMFSGTVEVPGIEGKHLWEHHRELAKPKRLAEVMGEPVWVVGGVGGKSQLSMTMLPEAILFHRDNWFVNWIGYKRRIEREEASRRQAEEREAWLERRAEMDREAAERRAANERQAVEQRARQWAIIRTYRVVGANKYDKPCWQCGEVVGAFCGNLRNVNTNGGSMWVTTCHDCECND